MFLKIKSEKKISLSTIKNVRNNNYLNAMNFIEQAISINNIKIIEMIVKVNSEFCAIKYQKIK